MSDEQTKQTAGHAEVEGAKTAAEKLMQTTAPATAEQQAIAAFQKAGRTMMRRMHEDKKYFHVMHRTETYNQMLEAFALSQGKVLPEMACLEPLPEMWAFLHAK